MPNSSGEQPGLNLLSLDGGGIAGLSSLLILKEIMTKVQEQDGRDTVPKPCEFFDMIAGTGTGAIFAVMLGRLRMDIDEAIRTYTQLMKSVFSGCKHTLKGDTGAFKSSVLERELKRIIGSVVGDGDEKMLEEEQADEGVRCKVIVNAATRCTIWEALRATTAHPNMFKSIQVDVEGTGSQSIFTHGGLGFTNPTPNLLKEVRLVYPGRGVRSVTSIGTGHPRTVQITNGHWLTSWGGGDAMMTKVMQAAHEMAEDSERVAEKMAQRYSPDGPLYYRLNLQQGTQRANAGKRGRLNKIAAHIWAYLDQAEVISKIDSLRHTGFNFRACSPADAAPTYAPQVFTAFDPYLALDLSNSSGVFVSSMLPLHYEKQPG
ncbi:hypothetical protein RSOLAG22IIIB_09351 [Rhizoctonia solani]|uniref:PNPLA domain-containing protein n=1 Tax=Rhizoctonia solani TaxID=456999 RepID=A0A0K6FYB7_9AGAM|nr:hypothetical protein RSOLAG22IIIB_09351 [Rhizoctonia solani]